MPTDSSESWVFGNECSKIFDSLENWHRVCPHRIEHHHCHERVFASSRFGNRSTTTIFGDRSWACERPTRGPGRVGKATATRRRLEIRISVRWELQRAI